MPYQAQRQSLFGAVGAPSPPQTTIDIPSSIDALTQGATSLIHGAMLRRQAQVQLAQRQQELDLAKQREVREADYQSQQLDLERSKANREFLTQGGQPGHTDVTATPIEVPLTPEAQAGLQAMLSPQPSRITQAMRGGGDQLPGPELTPSALPAPTTIQSSKPETVQTPDTVDVTKSRAFLQATDVARIRADVLQQVQAEKDQAAIERLREHDSHLQAIRGGSEKPIMVGGNPYYKNADGHLVPAQDEHGNNVTVQTAPPKPATVPQQSAIDARTDRELDVQISQAQRDRADAEMNAADTARRLTAATPLNRMMLEAQDRRAKHIAQKAQQKVDSLSNVKAQRAAKQQGSGTPTAAAPAGRAITRPGTPTPTAQPTGDAADPFADLIPKKKPDDE